jgi:hypothetical protein
LRANVFLVNYAFNDVDQPVPDLGPQDGQVQGQGKDIHRSYPRHPDVGPIDRHH